MSFNKYLKLLTIGFVVLSLFVAPNFFVKEVQAGCKCLYYPSYPSPVPGQERIGYLVETPDGSSCADLYGPGKAGVPPGTVPVEMSTASSGGCNPDKGVLDVGWRIPTFSELIGNIIRLIFFIAGLFALVYLLLGGFEWVQSAGDEKKLESARGKITNAVIGLVVMIAVLSLVIFLEQVVFGGKICLGISCPMNIGFLRIVGN